MSATIAKCLAALRGDGLPTDLRREAFWESALVALVTVWLFTAIGVALALWCDQ